MAERKPADGRPANLVGLFGFMTAGIFVFAGVIAVLVFFIAVRGAEQTMVPEVVGEDLTEALLELQVKELYPRIQLRYSQDPGDKGRILEQDPEAGTIVKAGRRVRLVVSRGTLVDRVGNYLGRNVEELRLELQALFASEAAPLLTLREPVMYAYSREVAGTILEQKPEPGTGVSGPTVVELVVSRGPEAALTRVPEFVGMGLGEALAAIEESGVDFAFTVRPAREGEAAERVAAQRPAGGSMAAEGTRVELEFAAPGSLGDGEAAGLFRYEMARNPYPLALRLEAALPSGERRKVLEVDYAGGPLAVPYRLPVGSVLTLSMLGREIYQETVTAAVEPMGGWF